MATALLFFFDGAGRTLRLYSAQILEVILLVRDNRDLIVVTIPMARGELWITDITVGVNDTIPT